MKEQSKPQTQVIRVGIAVVIHAERVLVGLRGPDTDLPGFNEFPGGKCLLEESAAECAIRECFEETGLSVDVSELLSHVIHQYEHRKIDISFFLCKPMNENALTSEAFNWIPIEQLETCHFPDGNRGVLQILKERYNTGTANQSPGCFG